MMPAEPGLLDTNVLVYAADTEAAEHESSRTLLQAARDPSVTLYVTSQIICEFYSVITNPRRVAMPCSPSEAQTTISALLGLPGIHVLPTPAGTVVQLMQLLSTYPVTGADVFDVHLVATMRANNIQRIYSFNKADFEVFPGVTVVVPRP